MPTLPWDDLEVVLALARAGTLGKAAASLGLDPTTVGRRLSAIHERLGFVLFDKTPAGLAIAPAARAVVAELEAMEAASVAADRALAAAAHPVHGRVRIACSEAFAMYWLLPVLEALQEDLPHIELELVASHGLADLRRREADIALRFVKPDSPELRARRLAALPWSIYGSAKYLRGRRPDPQRGLAGERLIQWGGPPLRPRVHAWLEAHAREARVVLIAAHLHVIVEACAAGHGLAALPAPIARGRALQRAIDHAIDSSDLWIVVHQDLRKVPRVRAVADRLTARISAAADAFSAI